MIFLLLFFPTIEGRNEESKRSIFEAKIARGKKKWSIFLFFRPVFERNRKGWDPRGRCPLVPPPRRNGRNGGRRKIFDFLALFIYRSPRKISYPRRSRLERRQLARRPFLRHPLLLFHARPSNLEGIRAVYLSVVYSVSRRDCRARIESLLPSPIHPLSFHGWSIVEFYGRMVSSVGSTKKILEEEGK